MARTESDAVFPATERDDVFESGDTTRKSGTGFGLSIVSQIVDARGWEIDVLEADGGGARFKITGVEFGSRVVGVPIVAAPGDGRTPRPTPCDNV